jgi:hypothetical protein
MMYVYVVPTPPFVQTPTTYRLPYATAHTFPPSNYSTTYSIHARVYFCHLLEERMWYYQVRRMELL